MLTRIEKVKETWRLKRETRNWDELCFDSKRLRVISEQNNCCDKCGINSWFGEPIIIEIDHVDGDNTRENLKGLCPNCHSQTKTWRGRNKARSGSGPKVSDHQLISALQQSESIRQALLHVGLSPKGGNYKRAEKLLNLYASVV